MLLDPLSTSNSFFFTYMQISDYMFGIKVDYKHIIKIVAMDSMSKVVYPFMDRKNANKCITA